MTLDYNDYHDISQNVFNHSYDMSTSTFTGPITFLGLPHFFGNPTFEGEITIGPTSFKTDRLSYLLTKLDAFCKENYPEDHI